MCDVLLTLAAIREFWGSSWVPGTAIGAVGAGTLSTPIRAKLAESRETFDEFFL
jgi:hypothetical protein